LTKPRNLNAEGRGIRGPPAAEKPAPLAYAIFVGVKGLVVGLNTKKKD